MSHTWIVPLHIYNLGKWPFIYPPINNGLVHLQFSRCIKGRLQSEVAGQRIKNVWVQIKWSLPIPLTAGHLNAKSGGP